MLNINYSQIVDILPNIIRRTPLRLDWLKLNLIALENDYLNLKADVNYYNFLAKHNAQVISMEHLLNNLLSPITPITIIDGAWLNQTYIFTRNDVLYEDIYFFTRSEALQDQWLYTRDEFVTVVYDFYVLLDTSDSGLEDKVRFWVSKYAQAGKKWDVVIV